MTVPYSLTREGGVGIIAMQNPPAQADALIEAIAAARNQVLEGWMPLLQPAAPAASLPSLLPDATKFVAQQRAYLEQQARLWSSLLAGRHVPSHACILGAHVPGKGKPQGGHS